MGTRPVEDWATDFDLTDPRWVDDPYPIWNDLRRTCPIAHSDRFQDGVFLPTRYEDVRAIAYDTDHFSSRRVVVRERKIEPPHPAPPITSDPPDHRAVRLPLLPAFSAKAVERLVPATRASCHQLLDQFIGVGSCDAALEFAQHVPTRVMAHLLGVPESDGDLFRHWIKEAMEEGIRDAPRALRALREIDGYFREKVEAYAGDGPDLVGHLLRVRTEAGAPLDRGQVVATLRLCMIAGIDTTWSAIGASLWHLATHPADQVRLASEPALMDTAVEELLRAYAPVTMAREVVAPVTVGGCPMSVGSMVLLSFPAANRDPSVFEGADEVRLDRTENRHVSFGLGIHRCLGSNLARMELRVALETWLSRIPSFGLTPGATVVWSEGTVRGPRRLPIVFPPPAHPQQ